MPEATPDLARAIRERGERALARGALQPIATERERVEDEGVAFVVRVISSSSRKPWPAQSSLERNPFLPHDPDLFVAPISETHVCLLNKFPVVGQHALVVTRSFEDQESPLDRADFAALWWCLERLDGLGFYNAGALAGASQAHKHLQLVPTPLGAGPERTPMEARIREGRLPFPHGVADVDPAAGAEGLRQTYLRLARELGIAGTPPPAFTPYNLLVTREWMLLVGRAREDWQGISVNALGFAGVLLVRDRSELERLRHVGPMHVLRHVTREPPA